jgi:hypothetical protein
MGVAEPVRNFYGVGSCSVYGFFESFQENKKYTTGVIIDVQSTQNGGDSELVSAPIDASAPMGFCGVLLAGVGLLFRRKRGHIGVVGYLTSMRNINNATRECYPAWRTVKSKTVF